MQVGPGEQERAPKLTLQEIMLNIGDLLDELFIDKTVNLVLPNNNRKCVKLNESIKKFDESLNDVYIQLNDVSLFKLRLNERIKQKEEAEKQKTQPQGAQQTVPQPQQKQQQQQAQPQQQQGPNNDFNMQSDEFNDNSLLNDINDFLSTVPTDLDMNNNEYGDSILPSGFEDTFNPAMNMDFGQNFQNDNGGAGNNNSNNSNNGNGHGNSSSANNSGLDPNMNFDTNMFSEIDSMLNI